MGSRKPKFKVAFPFGVAFALVLCGGVYLSGQGPVTWDFREFKVDQPYEEINSGSFRVEELTFRPRGEQIEVRFDIKNLTDQFRNPVLSIALFDKDRRLLAVGCYRAVMGFSARQTSTQSIPFDGDYGRTNVKFFSLRLGLIR